MVYPESASPIISFYFHYGGEIIKMSSHQVFSERFLRQAAVSEILLLRLKQVET